MVMVCIVGLVEAAGPAQIEPGSTRRVAVQTGSGSVEGRERESLARFEGVPVYLVENRGQVHEDVRFYAEGREKSVYFKRTGITVRLVGQGRVHGVELEFEGASPEVAIRAGAPRSAVFSYFLGSDPDGWVRGARSYQSIVYRGLWTGIDLVCAVEGSKLKFTYRVHPGADPNRIRMGIRGASSVAVDDLGALRIDTPAGMIVDEPPVAAQKGEGGPAAVEVAYQLEDAGEDGWRYGFRLGAYDRTRALDVDPAFLVYCGYIGGGRTDEIVGAAVDELGCLYVAGFTGSDQRTFPVKAGPGLQYGYDGDVFVAKVASDGRDLVYCGYIGTTSWEFPTGIAVDKAGCVYVTGGAVSNFPQKVGPCRYSGSGWGAFVTKVNAAGTDIVYSGLLGGDGDTEGRGIAVDAAGCAYITGETTATETTFPVKVGPDLSFNGNPVFEDVFVAKVNPQGTDFVYCGYIGGLGTELGGGVAVDRRGRAYVAGSTTWSLPVKVGPTLVFQGGNLLFPYDAFVARVQTDGTGLEYCGYIGGNDVDWGKGIAVDGEDRAYVVGYTASTEFTFPVKVGPVLHHSGGVTDAFVCRVMPGGEGFEYCGYIGGTGWDVAKATTAGPDGSVYVAGHATAGLPVKHGPAAHTYGDDAFVAKVNPQGTGIVYCGYIGGRNVKHQDGQDEANAIAVDRHGNAYVAGTTSSNESSFPVTVGPDLTYNDETSEPVSDGFVAKVALTILEGSGAARPGATVALALTSSNDPGRPYVAGTSLGTGPIPIDTRELRLTFDGLLWASVSGIFPSMFQSYMGTIGDDGYAAAALQLPDLPETVGVPVHSAFVTLDATAPSGIRSVSNTYSFTITR